MAGKLIDGDGLIQIKTWVEGNLANYLPLSAGSGKALTGNLYVNVIRTASGDLTLRTGEGDSVSIDSNADFEIKANGSFIASLNTTLLSEGRSFSFPNKSGTFALLDDISNVYNYKGSKTVAQFNLTDPQDEGNINYSALTAGDVYNVSDSGTVIYNNVSVSVVAGDNLAWDGSNWDKLAGTIDLSGYATTSWVTGNFLSLSGNTGANSIPQIFANALKAPSGTNLNIEAVYDDDGGNINMKTFTGNINEEASTGRIYLKAYDTTQNATNDSSGIHICSTNTNYRAVLRTDSLSDVRIVQFQNRSGRLALLQDLATEYSSLNTYAVGDYCFYNNGLHKCKVAITTAEDWNSNHWDLVEVCDEISRYTGAEVAQILNTGVLPA